MWLIWATIAGLMGSISSLATRKVYLAGNKDSWAFSFYFSFIGAIVTAPFIFTDFKVAAAPAPWALIVIVGIFVVIHNLLNFQAASYISPAMKGIIEKLRLAWIFFFGLLFLGEAFNSSKMIGTFLVILSGIILACGLIYSRGKVQFSMTGVGLAAGATFIYAANIILYKFLLVDFSATSLTFLVFLIPSILNMILMPDFAKRTVTILKNHPSFVIIACVAGAFYNLAMNTALAQAEASKVIVFIESFLIITLVAEKMLLREKDTFVTLLTKILAVVFAIVGAILIRLA